MSNAKLTQASFGWIAVALLLIIASLLAGPDSGRPSPALAAQATGDSLPTPTPMPTFTPQSAPAQTMWVGRLVSNTLGYTKGEGSIFRVYVTGQPGARIELRSDDQLIAADAGSKPEYGPFAAEFAPVTKGVWTVSVPSLGVGLLVPADNYNLAVIEFLQIPVVQATQAAQTPVPSPTPTALGGQLWAGRLANETWGIGAPFSRLLVQVVGQTAQPVQLSTLAQVINTANTGQKAELGADVVEFAGLTPGKYIIEPLGLNSRFEVELKPNTETRVEFRPQAPPPTLTPVPLPPTLPAVGQAPTAVGQAPTATGQAPTATGQTPTPLPIPPSPTPAPTATPSPTQTPSPTATATLAPSPTPAKRWQGFIAGRGVNLAEPASLKARMAGMAGIPMQLRAGAGNPAGERRCITGQAESEADSCTFTALAPGQYVVAPEGLGVSVPVELLDHEQVTVLFDLQTFAPGVTGWQARLLSNTNGFQAQPAAAGRILARLAGQAGQVVALRSARGTERFCAAQPNPALGSLACEFGGLAAGVYLVEAINTGAGLRLFVDGQGTAEVEFAPGNPEAAPGLPVVGWGAQPDQPAATAVPVPAATEARPASPTATPTPTITPTPPPAFAWQGYVVQTTEGVAGAIGVRVLGQKDQAVILRSGSWQSQPQLTGTKPELGDYATEFGGLAQGEYMVELVGLAELRVRLGPNQFMLVEFRYEAVPPH